MFMHHRGQLGYPPLHRHMCGGVYIRLHAHEGCRLGSSTVHLPLVFEAVSLLTLELTGVAV